MIYIRLILMMLKAQLLLFFGLAKRPPKIFGMLRVESLDYFDTANILIMNNYKPKKPKPVKGCC